MSSRETVADGISEPKMKQSLAYCRERLETGFKYQIEQILVPVLHFGDGPLITPAAVGDDYISFSVRFPFWLPDPSEEGKWLASKKKERKLRKGFTNYLKQKEFSAEIQKVLAIQLKRYLFDELRIGKKYPTGIPKTLTAVLQRTTAGRRSYGGSLPKHAITRILIDIRKWVEAIKKQTITTIADNVPEAQVPAHLRRTTPPNELRRLEKFLKLKNLPRKRYIPRIGTDVYRTDSRSRTAPIGEPRAWDIARCTALLAQAEIKEQTSNRYTLRQLEQMLRYAKPSQTTA